MLRRRDLDSGSGRTLQERASRAGAVEVEVWYERGSNQRRELANNGGEGGLPGFVARAYVSLVVYSGKSAGEGRTRAFKARVDKDKLSL